MAKKSCENCYNNIIRRGLCYTEVCIEIGMPDDAMYYDDNPLIKFREQNGKDCPSWEPRPRWNPRSMYQ